MSRYPPRIVSLLDSPFSEYASYAFWSLGSAPLELPKPAEPEDTVLYVARLAACCDILFLFLGLDNEVSLYIVRQVHRQRAPFRTVLFTGCFTATRETTTPLFDFFLSNHSPELYPALTQAAATPVPPRLSVDAVERQIALLITVENCFRNRWLPLCLQTSLRELRARDQRYVAAIADLARMTGESPLALNPYL